MRKNWGRKWGNRWMLDFCPGNRPPGFDTRSVGLWYCSWLLLERFCWATLKIREQQCIILIIITAMLLNVCSHSLLAKKTICQLLASIQEMLYKHVFLIPFLGLLSESYGWNCSSLPAHESVCDIFLLHRYLPLFVLSGVNKTSVLCICLCNQVLRPALVLCRLRLKYGWESWVRD